jgi:hypothetical protein
MQWFERHLNWTTLFFTIFAWMFGVLLVYFTLDIAGYGYLPIPGEAYVPYNPYSTATGYTFTVQTMVDVAVLVSLPVFYWVLKRKKHSLWYLLLFFLPLIPMPSPDFVLLFQMPFWIAGWIILLALKNKALKQGLKR